MNIRDEVASKLPHYSTTKRLSIVVDSGETLDYYMLPPEYKKLTPYLMMCVGTNMNGGISGVWNKNTMESYVVPSISNHGFDVNTQCVVDITDNNLRLVDYFENHPVKNTGPNPFQLTMYFREPNDIVNQNK